MDRVFRNSQITGALVSLFILLFFSYGHVFKAISTNVIQFEFRHRHLLFVWSPLFIILPYLVLKGTKDYLSLTRLLNVMGSFLLFLSLAHVMLYELNTRNLWNPQEILSGHPAFENQAQSRDIYYIILDSYGSDRVLKDYYGYDNGQFISWLQEAGFFVPEESFSNYSTTTLSLASSLNMTYIDNPNHNVAEQSDDLEILFQMIENSAVMQFLRMEGYHFIFLGSGRGISQENRFADEDIRCGDFDETMGRFIDTTFLKAFADQTFLLEKDERVRILCMFSELETIPDRDGSNFVFAHFPSPHRPILFDAHGNPVHEPNLSGQKLKAGYIDQLIFITNKVRELIDAILLNSEIDPIIIIQADTGPLYARRGPISIDDTSPDVFRERMGILHALYLPDNGRAVLYNSITPVNTFRLLFNFYFGTEFDRLEDELLFFYEDSYQFLNVSATVRGD